MCALCVIVRRVDLGARSYDLLLPGGLATDLLCHESAIGFCCPYAPLWANARLTITEPSETTT